MTIDFYLGATCGLLVSLIIAVLLDLRHERRVRKMLSAPITREGLRRERRPFGGKVERQERMMRVIDV